MIYDGTTTTTDPYLIEELEDDWIPAGYRAFILMDDFDHESPRTWGSSVATLVSTSPGDQVDDDVADLARMRERYAPHARWARGEMLAERYLSIFRPEILHYEDYWSVGRDQFGFGYVTRDGWEAAMGADYAGDMTPADLFEQELETFRQWAEGEVYGVIVTHPESGEQASLWSIYDQYPYTYLKVDVVKELLHELGVPEVGSIG